VCGDRNVEDITMDRVFRLFVSSSLLFASCGPSSQNFQVAEVVSVEKQALEEIRATPSTFKLSAEEDRPTWTRAKIFFENFNGGNPVLGDGVMKSSPSTASKVHYTIEKRWSGDGYRYTVLSQTPKTPTAPDQLMLYSKNVARFLQTGYLEVSLLK
jgi:hypothetical protein